MSSTDAEETRSAETRSRPRGVRRRRTLSVPRSIESYLKANSAPRYMLRLRDLENEFRAQVRRLETAYGEALEITGGEAEAFARRWRARARAWRFDRLNELVREHNAWYPMEANLPMDPRTGDYRLLRGMSYRRLELDATWILAHFPPDPLAGARIDRRALAPREPVAHVERRRRRAG